MWVSLARPALLALLLLLSPALAVRDRDGLETDLEVEVAAEAEAEFASGSGLQAGSLVLDRYELISVLDATAWPTTGVRGYAKISYLGKGAFGETWLARDSSNGKQVAIKFFYRPGYNGAVMLLNMRNANFQEKQQLGQAGEECNLPMNIIRAKSTPEGEHRFARCLENKVSDPQYAHLVLEVAGSENLEEYVQKRRSLSADVVKRLAKMMLEGLAHMEGTYVHRDIKPANLMVYEEGGQVYLRFIDFGLVVRDSTSGGIAGTPMFMPPEFWPVVPRSAKFTFSFDVYSTGETLYWLMCRQTFHEKIFNKYGGRGESDIQRALVSTDPGNMCSPPAGLTGLFSLVVGKMLKGSAAQRSRASVLLADSVFQGIDTSQPGASPAQQPSPQQVPMGGQVGGNQINQRPFGDINKPSPGGYGGNVNKNPNQPQRRPFGDIYDQINGQPRPQQPAARPFGNNNNYNRPQQNQPAGGRPFENVDRPQPQVVEAPQEPSLLDKCHDSKAFWFANVPQCCLSERYDPKRDAVCQRPCGPKVGYSQGQCANACQPTSSGQFEFSRTKYCCVARVWRDKCVYPDHIPSGEGWRWMAQENL